MSHKRFIGTDQSRFSVRSNIKKDSLFLIFLYQTRLGRFLLKGFISPKFSKMVGFFLNQRGSCIFISLFQKRNHIEMNRFEEKKYLSFNDFFSRSLVCKEIESTKKELCAPCDGKLSVYSIQSDITFQIKRRTYSIATLIDDEMLAKSYQDGVICVFRLCPEDYHRYHFFDDGNIKNYKKIPGVLHTVRPIAQEQFPIYHSNAREVTQLKTERFGTVLMVEVGALCVGKIDNFKTTGAFSKFEEKGTFLFGGSTIVLIFEKNRVDLFQDLLENTDIGVESVVCYGEVIGEVYEKIKI